MKYVKLIFFGILTLALVISIYYFLTSNQANYDSTLVENNKNDLIDRNDLISGGPPKDGIPSIDNPKFIPVNQVDWLSNDDEVFILTINQTTRIYPQQILVWHEIVNDIIEGIPIAVTYCPLCGSTVFYERVLDGEVVEFGTTGLLYNSNLVMYDRKTDSYWTQIRGEAVIGELVGTRLEKFPFQTMTWDNAKNRFSNAQVLSKDTGHVRSYGNDPYTDYYDREEILFPVQNAESEYDLGSKTIVIGLTINNESKAYTEFDLITQKNIIDTLGNVPIQLIKEPDGFLTIKNTQTGESIPFERDFWFAWLAFHPDTKLYSK